MTHDYCVICGHHRRFHCHYGQFITWDNCNHYSTKEGGWCKCEKFIKKENGTQ